MLDPNTIPSLMSDWSIKMPSSMSSWLVKNPTLPYLVICALLVLVVRIAHCMFKTWSVGSGEHGEDIAKWSFKKRFGHAFWGFYHDKLADHWLGAIIGFAEISFYPVLMLTNNLSAIGGWLAIKTAGSWQLWRDNPIAFNRWLVTNLINLAIAYFLTVKWIQ